MMLMMHSSPLHHNTPKTIKNYSVSLPPGHLSFFALPHQALGQPLRDCPSRNHPPHTPFNSLRLLHQPQVHTYSVTLHKQQKAYLAFFDLLCSCSLCFLCPFVHHDLLQNSTLAGADLCGLQAF